MDEVETHQGVGDLGQRSEGGRVDPAVDGDDDLVGDAAERSQCLGDHQRIVVGQTAHRQARRARAHSSLVAGATADLANSRAAPVCVRTSTISARSASGRRSRRR